MPRARSGWCTTGTTPCAALIRRSIRSISVKSLPGTAHYGYSDMTGIVARNATTRFGYWSVVHDSKIAHTVWGLAVVWNGRRAGPGRAGADGAQFGRRRWPGRRGKSPSTAPRWPPRRLGATSKSGRNSAPRPALHRRCCKTSRWARPPLPTPTSRWPRPARPPASRGASVVLSNHRHQPGHPLGLRGCL